MSPLPPLTSLQTTNGASSSMEPDEDIYVLLAQKERDLLLAAEIGQALLEKNEELSKQNEKIAEDFSKKLEVRNLRPNLPFVFFKLQTYQLHFLDKISLDYKPQRNEL